MKFNKRHFLIGFASTIIGMKSACAQKNTLPPPVPQWRPNFRSNTQQIVERFRLYTDSKWDFVVFENSTCCIVPPDLTEERAELVAVESLKKIFHSHPDMNPTPMKDGNVLVGYNEPAYNIVFADLAQQNWSQIEKFHLEGLTASEVIITPLGRNVFDKVGKMALLGRSWMFMDAQSLKVVRIIRSKS